MKRPPSILSLACLLLLGCSGVAASSARAEGDASGGSEPTPAQDPSEIRGLTVEERVGSTLPMELLFTTSEGKVVRLGDYFKTEEGKGGTASMFGGQAKPTVLMMVYYRCPIVCDVLMSKMTQTFEDLDFTLGSEYNALFFSIDDRESPEVSSAAKTKYFETYRRTFTPDAREKASKAWQFHTGDSDSVAKLANSVGYQFRKLPNGEFSHPVVAFIITPDGKLSRYLYGFKQEPRDLRLALMEASEGKLVRTLGDRLLAFCYMYDPSRGSYSLQAVRVMQVGGIVTLVGLTGLVGVLLAGERLRKRARLAAVGGGMGALVNQTAGAGSARGGTKEGTL
jgi:protein SCO1/2